MERWKGRTVRNIFIESARVAIACSMFACTESLLITLDVSYLYMRVLLRISEYFCCNLYVLGLGYSTNAKKKGLDSALCLEIYTVNLYFNAYWLFVCVARYLCISSLVIFILFWVQDSAHLLLIWLPSSQSPADNFYHGGAHILIGRVIVCPNYSHALFLQMGWRQWN